MKHITDKKCPKCGSKNFTIIELWQDAAIYFEVENGVVDRDNGSLEPGNPHKLQGRCNCGHRWTFKRVSQIDELIN